jgi:hypothetical protein
MAVVACSSIFIAAFFLDQPASSATKYTTIIKLRQHSKINGDEVVWLSPTSMRVENPRSHLVWIARAPDWTVYEYSLETKKYFVFPYGHYVNRIAGSQALFGGIVLVNATCTKSGSEQFLDHLVDRYVADAEFQRKGIDMRRTHSVGGNFPKTFVYKTLPVDLFPPQEAHLLACMHAVVDLHAIPLDMTCTSFESKVYKFLSTQEIQPAVLTAAQEELPAGLVRVKTEGSLTSDDATQRDMLDFVEGHK